MGYVAVIMLQ